MSNSNLVNIQVPAHQNNFTSGRNGKKIEMITIHHMAGILSAEQCGYIFQNSNKQASSHYCIGKDGEIGQFVNEENTAWTNGNWDSNCKAVTIETSNCEIGGDWKVSDIVLNKLIQLIADIAKRNNLEKLVKGQNLTWHSIYRNTNCPGKYLLSKLDYIIEQANRINEYGDTVQSKKSVDEIADEVIAGKFGNGQDRKNNLINIGYDPNMIQNIVNQKLNSSTSTTSKKAIDEIAREVIRGDWGNGQDRKNKLTSAGYNSAEIQNRVNQLL